MAETQAPDVSTRNTPSRAMLSKAILPRTLMGGTEAMRKSGQAFLPCEPKETQTAWQIRCNRTVLFNAFGKAVGALTGKLFQKSISLSEEAPEPIKELLEDVDGQSGAGRDFNRFLSHVTADAMVTGLTHILVDMPAVPRNEDGTERQLTVEEAKVANMKPRWLHYKLEDAVSWRFENNKLARIVLKECITEADGEWGEKEVEQFRVLYPGRWEIWQESKASKNNAKVYIKTDEGTTILNFIPLVTIYCAKQTGPLTVEAPLLNDLAYLNVAHWQSSSDQRHILHVARVPILFATGWADAEEGAAPQEIGPNRLISQPQSATLEYVEHTGSSIKAGEEDLKKLEEQMSQMAMEPLVSKTGNITATATAIGTAEATSALQDIAQGLKDAVEQLLVCTGAWLAIPPEQCGEATVNADFSLNMDDSAALAELTKARQFGDLSREAYLNELKRRNKLAADFDIGADKELVDAEGQALGLMNSQPTGQGV